MYGRPSEGKASEVPRVGDPWATAISRRRLLFDNPKGLVQADRAMFFLPVPNGGRNPVSEAISRALSNSPPGARAVAVERRWYGGSITDAVVHMADGSSQAYFTGLAPEEFDAFLSELALPADGRCL